MIAALAAIFVLLAISTAGFALYFAQSGGPTDTRVRAAFAPIPGQEPKVSFLRRAPSSIPPLRRLLNTSEWADRAAMDLDRAHVGLRVGEYLLMRVIVGLLLVALPLLFTRGSVVGIVIAMPLGVLGFMLPAFWVELRRRRRVRAIDRQLVEGLTQVSSSIRAGFAMLQAIDGAALRLQPPLSEEFARLVADVRLGSSLEDSLISMGERIESYDLDLVITATLIQRETGGNLAEILDNVTETIRERDRIRGEIRTLTASQRFTSSVISVWPIVLAFVFFLLNPDLISNLWEETAGIILLLVAGGLQILGFLTIRRVMAIEI